MSTFEVRVQPIFIKNHPTADRLDLANIGSHDGWQCVVAKGRFVTGDLVAYIGENAIVPDWVLKKYGYWNVEKDIGMLAGSKGNRVKAIKLRGEFSLGICIPVEEEVLGYDDFEKIVNVRHTLEGEYVQQDEDVSELLGVTKYEAPIPVALAGEVCNLTGYTLKYDIENYKNFTNVIEEGEEVIFTEKIHGCIHPDTKIMLPNGEEVSISNIIEDDRYTQVWSYDVESKQFMSKQITGRMRRPNTENKRWIKMILENGRQLRITEDHPVFSEDRDMYIEAKHIIPGENIKSPL